MHVSDRLFIPALCAGAVVLWLVYVLSRRGKRSLAQEMQAYLTSDLRAKDIAFRINSKKIGLINDSILDLFGDDVEDSQLERLFISSLDFDQEGIFASVLVKNGKAVIGISYKPDSRAFAKKVEQILRAEFVDIDVDLAVLTKILPIREI